MDASTTTKTIRTTAEHAAPLPPIAFTRIGRHEVKAEFWACGSCGAVYKSEAVAAACCTCSRCGKSDPLGGRYAKHVECKRLDEDERNEILARRRDITEARQLLAATPILSSEYSEPVFWGERLIMDVDDVESEHECSDSYEEGKPSFVFGTTLHTLELDADATLTTALEQDNMDDEAGERVSPEATNALALGIAAWNEQFGTTVKSYSEDCGIVVVLDEEGFYEAIHAARDLLADLTIAKGLCVALYLLTARESVQDFVWSRRPWIQTSWWKLDS